MNLSDITDHKNYRLKTAGGKVFTGKQIKNLVDLARSQIVKDLILSDAEAVNDAATRPNSNFGMS